MWSWRSISPVAPMLWIRAPWLIPLPRANCWPTMKSRSATARCEAFPDAAPVALLRCADEQVRLPGGDDDLDGVLNPVAGVVEGGRQIGERERMGVNPRRVEALFGH